MRVLVTLLFFATTVFAGTPAPLPLSQAEVAVADQSAPALQLGLQAAFAEVMVKMSGNPNIMSVPQIQSASSNVMQWLQSYTYRHAPSVDAIQNSGLILQVVFNHEGLRELLKTATQGVQLNAPPPSELQLFVIGVKDMQDYSALLQALKSKPGVAHVSVAGLAANRVALMVQLAEDRAHFVDTLGQDAQFKALVPPQAMVSQENGTSVPLYYLWERRAL